MNFDLSTSLRRLKPEQAKGSLRRRGADELPFLGKSMTAGPPLLLDTTVYIDTLQNRLPDEAASLMRLRQLNHSSVAVAELAHSFGRLDPAHPGTASVLASIREAIDQIPTHRIDAPSIQATIEAGILTGVIARMRGLSKTNKLPLFNDVVLVLQALEQGCVLLSRNAADMDIILQLLPAGRVLLYGQDA